MRSVCAALAVTALVACSRRDEPSPAAVTSTSQTPIVAAPPVAPDGMVLIPAGSFVMGTDRGAGYEGPPHTVRVAAFFLDSTEVTNEAFARFVAETKHVTRAATSKTSAVFLPAKRGWSVVAGATWQHPEGPSSTIDARARHPVVHVAWSDAVAFCAHRLGRLPTEVEWERAARGPSGGTARFAWGDGPTFDDGGAPANTWQGRFPEHDEGSDGFVGTSPVGSFPPGPFGLQDMAGNVWEWTDDWFDAHAYEADGAAPSATTERVIRGGSWLCGPGHCIGYRVAARGRAAPDEPTNHVGFRCARSVR